MAPNHTISMVLTQLGRIPRHLPSKQIYRLAINDTGHLYSYPPIRKKFQIVTCSSVSGLPIRKVSGHILAGGRRTLFFSTLLLAPSHPDKFKPVEILVFGYSMTLSARVFSLRSRGIIYFAVGETLPFCWY